MTEIFQFMFYGGKLVVANKIEEFYDILESIFNINSNIH